VAFVIRSTAGGIIHHSFGECQDTARHMVDHAGYMGRNCREIARESHWWRSSTMRTASKLHPPRTTKLWLPACPPWSPLRAQSRGLSIWAAELAFDGPAVASVAPSRRRQDFVCAGSSSPRALLYEEFAKATQTEGCCQYAPAGVPGSFPYAMLVGIADSRHPLNTASCRTISCVIASV
jgi:hypothetical protein